MAEIFGHEHASAGVCCWCVRMIASGRWRSIAFLLMHVLLVCQDACFWSVVQPCSLVNACVVEGVASQSFSLELL